MNISEQDQNIIFQDSARHIPDSSIRNVNKSDDSSGVAALIVSDSVPRKQIIRFPKEEIVLPADTTSVCTRNAISDVTFHDSTSFVLNIDPSYSGRFPFFLTGKNKIRETESLKIMEKHLKEGEQLPERPYHDDWMIFIVIVSALLYTTIRIFPGSVVKEITRFFNFRGIGDPASRDTGALFHWQSTVINLITFFNLALFAYCAAFYYDFIPQVVRGISFWIISLFIIVISVTARHLICIITGTISGEREIFNEYIVTVYHSYRIMASALFVISILLSYTNIFPPEFLIITGFFIIGILYLIRIIRLLFIFMKRNISLFSLILYLCALEILPVLISVKYFTGLF